jgi:membrane associated rhomboid family serine protease
MSEMPRATGVVVSITAIVTGLQWIVPGLPELMQRSPAVLTTGEWWRLITPIFINRPYSAELILNLVALLAVGAVAERCWGSRRWLLFYFVGGLIGESAGLAWRPTGMGSSVAVCGLLGALRVQTQLIKARMPRRQRGTGLRSSSERVCRSALRCA